MIFRNVAGLLLAFALAGCIDAEPPVIGPQPDQCLRAELFRACMAALPAGPVATRYNDWDEVVEECESVAYYQSLRSVSQIRPECSAESAQ